MAAVMDEELDEEFNMFGIQLDDIAVIDKLKDVAAEFKWSAGSLVEEWLAFSATGAKTLTIDNVNDFRLKKLDEQHEKSTRSQVVKVSQPTNNNVFKVNNIDDLIAKQDALMLEAYQTPETKTSVKRLHTTPESAGTKMQHTLSGRTPTTFSPITMATPTSATPAKRYEVRENADKVVCTHNPSGMEINEISWKGHHNNVEMSHVGKERLMEGYKYMFHKMINKSQVLNERIDKMATILKETYKIAKFSSPTTASQDEATIVGRICCDKNGKLNPNSLVLKESGWMLQGRSVKLDVSHVNQYSLFQGQVAAIKGKNTTGNLFVATSVYEPVLPEPNKTQSSDSLSIFIVAGPFTTSDSLRYEPLLDFLKVVQKEQPDAVVMIGPFVDIQHDAIQKGNIGTSFQQFFSLQMETISKCANSLSTQFYIIPSLRDAHHDCVYPQPPFVAQDIKSQISSNLHFLPDPSTIELNGFTLGVTSTDVLFHLGGTEITHPPGSDKMGRLVKHILTQQCYYPVFPPSDEMCIDHEMFVDHAYLPCKPDVLIVPSKLRYFVKNVLGCLSINPGMLAKGLVGGSFARALLKKDPTTMGNVVDRSVVEIVRI